MYHPTTRVLTVLELLQSYGRMTGADLARRLEVDIRTARRYIVMLQDLGVPIEAERGRYGAYVLRAGTKLPPLMFSEEEAVAVTLGLLAARRLGWAAGTPAIEGTLAKVQRVLPAELQDRVAGVATSLAVDLPGGDAPPPGAIMGTLSAAVYNRRRVWMQYGSAHGEETERTVDVYGVVYHEGHWYATGYCHLRGARRLLRVDRIRAVSRRPERFTPPPDFDAVADVAQALAHKPGDWEVEVVLGVSLAEAQQRVAAAMATLEAVPRGVLLRCATSDLPWMARYLAGLNVPMVIRAPQELRTELLAYAEALAATARRSGADG